jgi:hypothetical protein
MELKNMKKKETQKVKVYYEWIQKLTHGLQVPTTYRFRTIVFRVGLKSYLRISTVEMKRSTLQHHKEVTMLCEKCMTTIEAKMHFQYHRVPNM